MNMYSKLSTHLERHQYKRGQYKGDAPADKARRSKNHFRVTREVGTMGVMFHQTQIITAYPDGQVRLTAGGYEDHMTTRKALREMGFVMYTKNNNGYKNTMVRMYSQSAWGPVYVYYSGMVFNEVGVLVGEPAVERKYVADRDARKEFKASAKDFLEMLPILLATSAQRSADAVASTSYYESRRGYRYARANTQMTLSTRDVEKYPELVDAWRATLILYEAPTITPARVWSAIYNMCTRRMRNEVNI